MQKFLQRMMLLAAFVVLPWAMFAQGVAFSYDFEPGSADSANWTILNVSGSSAWVIGTAEHAGSGNHAIYISNNNGTGATYNGATAAVDFFYREVTLPAGDYVLSFDWKCEGESTFDYLRVALVPGSTTLTAGTTVPTGMSASALPTGWMALDGGSKLNLNSTWTHHVAEFQVATAGTYKLVFVWRNDGSTYHDPGACVDNIDFGENTCPLPTVSLAALGEDFATVSWLTQNVLSYELMYGENGFGTDTAMVYAVNNTTYNLQNLSSNTLYSVYVRAICGVGDTSQWSVYTFRTPCTALTTLPYFQDFEAEATTTTTTPNLTFANCWTHLNNGTLYFGHPYISSTASHNHTTGGARGLYWGSIITAGTYGDYQCIVFPPVDDDVFSVNTLQVSFWAKATSTSYHPVFQVGVMTNPNDITTFQQVGTVNVEGTEWTLHEMPLSSYSGTGTYVAIKAVRPTTTWYAAVDDLTLDVIPSCPHPGIPYTESATENTVDVSWTEYGSASAWELEYATSDITPGQGYGTTVVVTDTTTTLYGLSANTLYHVYVRSLCGVGDTSDWSEGTIRTSCGMLSSFPYVQDFEAENTTTSSSATFIPCWGHLNNGTSYPGYPYLSSTASYNHTTGGARGLYWYGSTTTGTYGDYYCIVLPQIDTDAAPINSLQLNFWSKATLTSYHPVFQVGVMTDPNDITTFQAVQTINVSGTTWTEYEAPLSSFNGEGSYVAIKATRPSTTWYAAMDDIMLARASSCERPEDFEVAYSNADSVVLTWSAGGTESEWVVSYNNTEEVVYDTVFVLEQFVPNTDYTFTLRAVCGDGDTSLPLILTVRTPCEMLDSLPYTWTFESEATGSSTSAVFASCWTRLNNGTTYFGYPYVGSSSSYNHTSGGTKGLHWYMTTTTTTYGDYEYVIFPSFDAEQYPVNTLQVSFWSKASSISSHPVFQVGVMTNPMDVNSFQNVNTINVEGTDWTEFSVPLSSYAGTGSYVAIRALRPTSAWTAYMDDVTLEFAPSCVPPVELTASHIVADSAVISWTPGSVDDNSWNVTYITAGQQPVTLYGIADTAVVLTGLMNNVDYTVLVQTDCSGDTSMNASMTFHSACGDVQIPYTENFDSCTTSTTSATNVTVPCWSSYMDGSATYQAASYQPMIYYSTTYSNSGNYCLRLYGQGFHSLPRFEAPLDTLQISFSLYTTSASYSLALYAVEDTGYAFIADVTAPATSAHNTVSLFLSSGDYHGNSHQLAFRNYNNSSSTTYYSYNYIDDISVTYLPACPPVTNLEASPDSTEITIIWHESGSATSWYVEYGAHGFTQGQGTSMTVTTESATFTGLTSNTAYDFYVTPNCSGAPAAMATFSTTGTYLGLPFSCDFENAAQNTAWNFLNGTCTNKWYIGSAVNNGGSNSLYISDNNGVGNTYTITTASMVYAYVDIMFPVAGDYGYSFDWRANGESTYDFIRAAIVPYSYELVAGTTLPTGMSASSLPSDFIALDGGSKLNLSTTWQSRSDVAHISTPGVYHVGFAWRNDGSGGTTPPAAIDNFEMVLMTCPRPDSLTVSNITQNSADFAWNEPGSATTWQWTVDGTTINTVTSTNVSVTGLSFSSPYTFGVRSICGDGDTSIWRFVSFNTVCGAVSMPYVQDFENEATTTSSTANSTFANCWHHLNNGTSYPGYPYIGSSISYNHTTNGTKGLYWYGSTTTDTYGDYYCIVLPESAVAVDSLQLSFWTKAASASYTPVFRIGVMTDPTSISSFVPVDTVTVTGTAWTQYEVVLSNYAGTGRYVAIRGDRPTSAWYAYMDDISLDYIPACPAVTDVVVTEATRNSITLDWTDVAPASSWEIEYGVTGFAQGQGTTITVYAHPAQVTGLTSATCYDFYVRPVCASGSSLWRNISYYTRCDAVSIPYAQDFELENTTTSSTPNITFANCWMHHNNGTSYMGYPYIANSSTYNHTANGSKGLYWYGSTTTGTYGDYYFVVLPESEVAVDSLQLSFWAKASSASYVPVFKIGVMTNPDSIETFVGVDTLTITTGTEWTEFEVPLNAYAGTGKFVAIKADRPTSSWYAYMDDILLDYTPTCPKVRDVEVTAVTLNSATIDWTDVTTPSSWEVEYGPAGFTQGQGSTTTVTSHPATITGLNAATLYDFYVRPVCGANDYGYWSTVCSAATECAAISAPYAENFDAVAGTTYSTAGLLPACWEAFSNGTTAAYVPHVVSNGSYWYAVTANSLVMTSGSTASYGNNKLVRLPEFIQPVNSLTMSFWMSTESSSSGTLSVGYFTGDNLLADFVPVKEIPASNDTYHGSSSGLSASGLRDTVVFDSVPADALYIGFKWYHNSTYYSCCIDDVVVTSTVAGCVAPQLNAAAVTAETADITWNGSSDDNFQVAVKSAAQSTWNDSVDVMGNTYHFAGLLPETEYYYRVRKVCDTDQFSPWTVGTFTTDELPCFAPTNFTAANVGFTTAAFSWTPVSNETHWGVRVWNSTFDSTYVFTATSCTISGLNSNVDYNAAVMALCGAEGTIASETWSDTISFTTNLCDPVTNVTNTVTANTATITWTPGANNNGNWEVRYGLVGFVQGDEIATIPATTNTVTINGLEYYMTYDAYVRATCEAGVFSAWSTKTSFYIDATGIHTVDGEGTVSIYPNPATGNTTISLAGIAGNVNLTIVDMNGRTVRTEQMECDGTCVKVVDVEGLASGAYFVRVSSDSYNAVKKLIVK